MLYGTYHKKAILVSILTCFLWDLGESLFHHHLTKFLPTTNCRTLDKEEKSCYCYSGVAWKTGQMVHITTPKVKQEKSIKLKVVQHQNRDVK